VTDWDGLEYWTHSKNDQWFYQIYATIFQCSATISSGDLKNAFEFVVFLIKSLYAGVVIFMWHLA